jgi:tetratricopeptide (TPR) repeat protein
VREALRFNPQLTTARLLLAEMLEKQGNIKGAADELNHAIVTRPDFWQGYYHLGRLHLEAGDAEKAKEPLQKMIEVQPDNALGPFWLGVTYMTLADYPKAREQFEQASKLNPRMAAARFQLAKAYMEEKAYPEALKVLQQILKQRSDSTPVHRALGDVYTAQGHYREALEEYQAALLNGDIAQQYPKLGEIAKSSLGDAAKAEAFRNAFEQVHGEISDQRRSGEREGPRKKRRGMRGMGRGGRA